MPPRPDWLRRNSLRLSGYDYRQTGAYFVTICTHNRDCLFGIVADGKMQMNDSGFTVQACWRDLPRHYAAIVLDAFIVMPNHVHAVIILPEAFVGVDLKPAPASPSRQTPDPTSPRMQPATATPTTSTTQLPPGKRHGLSEIVRAFKTFSARGINAARGTPSLPLWQRGYYDHIIRGEAELTAVRDYILTNPARWDADRDNPAAHPHRWSPCPLEMEAGRHDR